MTAVVQPSGTVTLVFTDIEGSTRLLEELGTDAYREALAEHRRIVRDACALHEGYEVDYEGDAFFYAFATAQAAVAAVSEAMSGLDHGPIRIRVGIHTGTPALDPPKYIGIDVHRAARIMSAAHGGQVVLSRETTELLDGSVELKDLGNHHLKDFDAPERIHQLGTAEHPPLKSLYRVTLPVPATPFLGREPELDAVLEHLADPGVQLLTLTGPGGTGKTRLALQAAARASDDFPDGVTWVGLAPLRDPALVVPAIAEALDLREQAEQSPIETVAHALLGKKALVLVDNAEHLLPEIALQLAELIAACPTMRLLVTSRERLQITAETMWPVPTLSNEDSIELFVQRARRVRPGFEPTPEVSDICIALDHLPLAIELAAARVGVLSPPALLERLGRRLELLRHGPRDTDARQRTLEATIAWSYDLLASDEQQALRQLSVFAGGWTEEAAASIADADLDLLESLIDKSLVRHRVEQGQDRYWMLETIREFGGERLRSSGNEKESRRTHATWFATRAAEVRDDERALVLAPDDDNLRLALLYGTECEPLLAVQLARTLTPYWFYRGRLDEADHWGGALLEATRGCGPERADALALAGRFRLFVDDPQGAKPLLEEALVMLRAGSDGVALAQCLADLGAVERVNGHIESAIQLLTEAVELHRQVDDDPYESTAALHFLGEALRDAGQFDAARARFSEVVAVLRSIRAETMAASTIHSLGDLELDAGRPERARAAYLEALEVFRRSEMEREIGNCLGGLSAAAAALGDAEQAAALWGAVESIEERLGRQLFEHERERYVPLAAPAQELHPDSFAAGKAWSLDDATACALGETRRSEPGDGAPTDDIGPPEPGSDP